MLNIKETDNKKYLEIRQEHLDFHLMAELKKHSYRFLQKIFNIAKSQIGLRSLHLRGKRDSETKNHSQEPS